ncbi:MULTISPECIES: DUF6907 domain-containing protein [Nocardia]|uniref:DUF6907 domain-containing protein n=1 Tax=Nocardia TaxID=1817 RepID=UPI00130088E0|nr:MULTISPECIES: hypothetical protein [Nocardia]
MAEVMACPAWCSEHVDPDPSEPGDEGAHFGQQLTVAVTKPPGLSDDQSFVVQLAAHDYRGQRETMIYLDNPGRGVAQITEWQAKAIVVNLLHATELCDSTNPAGIGCPQWCIEDHDDTPEDEPDTDGNAFHASAPMTVEVWGPTSTDTDVSVRVVALDNDRTRRIYPELMLSGSHTPLGIAEACKIAGNLLEAVDLTASE